MKDFSNVGNDGNGLFGNHKANELFSQNLENNVFAVEDVMMDDIVQHMDTSK